MKGRKAAPGAGKKTRAGKPTKKEMRMRTRARRVRVRKPREGWSARIIVYIKTSAYKIMLISDDSAVFICGSVDQKQNSEFAFFFCRYKRRHPPLRHPGWQLGWFLCDQIFGDCVVKRQLKKVIFNLIGKFASFEENSQIIKISSEKIPI